MWLSVSDGYLLRKETNTRLQSSSWGRIILQLTKDLERSFCTVCFDNFFNSPKLFEKLLQKGIYGIGAVRANRKQMPKIIGDKQMKRGDCQLLFSSNTMACN